MFFAKVAEAQDRLSDDVLSNLKAYKYSSIDRSFISRYILQHYWTAFVELLPLWLAPNMVTLIGFMFILGNVLLLEIFVPDLVGPGPSWLYYSFALGIWMYSTMDNADGKQARRTGTSSPLGEMFDHGIDSLNCTLASLLEVAATMQGSTKMGAFTALLPCLPMWFSTWETFHTHTLYLGYINGPTEGLIIATLMIIASGWYGPQIWTIKVVEKLGHPEIFGEYSFQQLFVFILGVSFLFGHLPACVLNVVEARRRQGLPVLPAFYQWISISIVTFAVVSWVYSPYSNILKDDRLVLFCVTICFVFGRMTTKIILAHLTKQEFPCWTVLMIPLVIGAVLINLPILGFPPISPWMELFYLRTYLVVGFIVYMHWALFIINRVTTYLGINCLVIREDKSRARDQVYRNFGEGLGDVRASSDSGSDVRLKHH